MNMPLSSIKHHKESYHPLFVILFLLELLPKDAVKNIPSNTKKYWRKKDWKHSYGIEYCKLYLQHFDDVKYAHQYTFSRQVLCMAIQIQKTFLLITQSSLVYKKLLRTQAHNMVAHISLLVEKGFSAKQACKLFSIKPSWYQYHKRKINCMQSKLRTCFRQTPNQLTYKEQCSIYDWIHKAENKFKSITQLFYEALNKGIVMCGLSTFAHYAHISGYKKTYRKTKAKTKSGYRAKRIFECLHIDTTYLPTYRSGIQKIIFVRDNYSKAILHFSRLDITTSLNSHAIKSVLQETFAKYKLLQQTQEIQIVSDGGSENKGEATAWVGSIKAPPIVKKVIAKTTEFTGSNSMVEGGFHLLKHDFLKGEMPLDEADTDRKINEFIEHISNRYFGELYGITPKQILEGERTDKHRFKDKIQQAKTERIKANKAFVCKTT